MSGAIYEYPCPFRLQGCTHIRMIGQAGTWRVPENMPHEICKRCGMTVRPERTESTASPTSDRTGAA